MSFAPRLKGGDEAAFQQTPFAASSATDNLRSHREDLTAVKKIAGRPR
jgi:hypothetical protein